MILILNDNPKGACINKNLKNQGKEGEEREVRCGTRKLTRMKKHPDGIRKAGF